MNCYYVHDCPAKLNSETAARDSKLEKDVVKNTELGKKRGVNNSKM